VNVQVSHWVDIPMDAGTSAGLFFIELHYDEGEPDTYQLPLALSVGREMDAIVKTSPQAVIAHLTTDSGPAVLHDATVRQDLHQALLRMIENHEQLAISGGGSLNGRRSTAFVKTTGKEPLHSRAGAAEQSNTSILYGQKMILKLFRRLQPGENPDVEIGRFLTEVAHFARISPLLGEITLEHADGVSTSVAMLQELVRNEGDGWQWTLEELARFFEAVSTLPAPHDEGEAATFVSDGRVPAEAREHAGLYMEAATLLGRRTAEMHFAMATPTTDEAFRAEPFTADDLARDARRIDAQIHGTLDALKSRMSSLKDETADEAATLLSRRIELFARAHAITGAEASGQRIRIHGDYHLGQVLRAKNDFVLLDFEGEPARTLEERRRKQCPLKDVAGMLRSFSYAGWSALETYVQRHPDRLRTLEPWVRMWQNVVSTEFLLGYRRALAERRDLLPEPEQADSLLHAYLLEKALYELLYELNNRPAWVRIPMAGILALPQRANDVPANAGRR
jgi:maltose alpha-D-glucosyltransferase/alpha-amylase